MKDETPLADEEREDEANAEADNESRAMDTGSQLEDEEQLDAGIEQEITGTESTVPAEVAAIHTDTVSAKEAGGSKEKSKKKELKPKTKQGKASKRSSRYQKATKNVDLGKKYALPEALKLAAASAYTSFDGSVELHIKLAPGKEGESIRGLLQLPHGTGRKVKAVVLSEDLIEQIRTTKKVEADILVAPTSLMPKVAKIAKILGPIGKMPSPKAGTVSDKPEEVVAAIGSGRVEYRADTQGIVHQVVGKSSWPVEKLVANAEAILGVLPRNRLLTVTVAATMGPGVRVDLNSIK